jgi:hypothetical protein
VLSLKISGKVLADNALKVVSVIDNALRSWFRVFLPSGGFGIVSDSVTSVAVNRVVHFKDGTFKEYPVATKEQLDFYDVGFYGSDKRLDDYGEKIIMGSSHGRDVFVPPVLDVKDGFGQKYGYRIVGQRPRFNLHCDEYVRTTACLHVENHLVNVGLVPTHLCTHHCYSYECCDCYFWGACVRAAGEINGRLLALADILHRSPEAGMISVPESLYGASEEVLRKWSVLAAKNRGLDEFNFICHPFRYRSSFRDAEGKFHLADWKYSHHYHFLGFFCESESYDICRSCPDFSQWYSDSGGVDSGCNRASFCGGFQQKTRRCRAGYVDDSGKKVAGDGFIMKVFDKREDFFNTAAYELSHSGFKIGSKRIRVSSWYGKHARAKIEYVRRRMLCPEEACRSEFVPVMYSGGYEIVKSSKSPDFERNSWMPYMENNKVVWNEVGVTYHE